ncbi:MAG: hypothetical protein HUJ25_06820 [Crocinitomicaceae bacterium]|nr:hypothetical protein [Crocinitomicaceae bacterium]
MIKRILIIFLCFGVVACNGSSEEGETGENNNFEEDKPFVSEITIIDTTYPPLNEKCIEVMEKMQMCTTTDTSKLAPCSNKYFRVFDHKPQKDWGAGFIVEMVPGLYGAPVHQIVIIEEYLGKYKIANQYLGFMIEMRTTELGYSDLLIGYEDPDVGLIAIRHEWQGNKYDLVDVEEINNHFVKPEMKDSVNNIFLPAFSAGF